MSNVQFENSWQATDGRWYPLESHPSHPSHPSQPVDHGPAASVLRQGEASQPARNRSNGLVALVGVGALVLGLAAGAGAFALLDGGSDGAGGGATEPLVTEALVDTGSPDDPLELGDEFALSVSGSEVDVEFFGRLHGVVELPASEFSEGECVAVIGEVAADAESVLEPVRLNVSVAIDDNLQTRPGYGCDTTELLEEDYVSLGQLSIVPGEPVSFYTVLTIDDEPDHVGLGPFRNSSLFSYEYELIDEIPDASTGDAPDVEVVDSGDVVVIEDRDGTSFEVSVLGYVEVPVSEFADTPGAECYVVLATYRPIESEQDYALLFDWLRVGTDGAATEGRSFDCEDRDLEQLGYAYEFDVEPRVGVEVATFRTIVSGTGAPDYALVGSPDREMFEFDLDELDEVPDR